MFSRHLFKMLIGLIGMGLLGLMGLYLINLYDQQTMADDVGNARTERGDAPLSSETKVELKTNANSRPAR